MPGYGRSYFSRRFGGGPSAIRGFVSSYGGYGYGGGGYGGYDFAAELERERMRDAREQIRYLQQQARGSRRRQVELERFGKFVPAGEWDADCEAWPEKSYTWRVGSIEMEICRGPTHAWNGYVTLPEGYPHREKPYDFWNNTYTSGLPKPPVRELTYGNTEGLLGGATPVGKFGFDHSWGGDRQPMVLKPGTAGNHDGCVYTTAEKAVAEVWRLAAYFASLVLDGTLRTTAEWMAEHKESLLRIVEQDMRIADDINKKKRAAAAEAARITAERAVAEAAAAAARAAEEARLAAEAAERQRLWDEAHPEEAAIRKAEERARLLDSVVISARSEAAEATARKQAAAELYTREKERLVRVREILQEIEALRAREEAGEVLTKAEDRQLNREDQLRSELKNREKGAALHEDKKLADATAAASAADEKSAAAQAAAGAATAEVQQLKDAWAAKQAAAAAAAERAVRHEALRKRLDRVKKLLASIQELRERRAAGEVLDPLQIKKMTRRQALEKEDAEIQAELES
jgi:hypothetical protein